MAIAAILLAAGESRRMGCPKALLDWDGRPLLAYQLAELDGSRVDRVVVVLGHRARDVRSLCRGLQAPKEAQREGPSHCVGALAWAGWVQVIVNPHYRQGPTTSIRAGVAALPPEVRALLVLRVDQPRPHILLDALVEAHLARASLITMPTYQGR
ncbi:MAG TPA: NTP transferase domain-containing protein, partial [Dehalococcoidia bacterium]|nr:NTP transferase domain-containing protein [Dehalococcoidia bacterium]